MPSDLLKDPVLALPLWGGTHVELVNNTANTVQNSAKKRRTSMRSGAGGPPQRCTRGAMVQQSNILA